MRVFKCGDSHALKIALKSPYLQMKTRTHVTLFFFFFSMIIRKTALELTLTHHYPAHGIKSASLKPIMYISAAGL